jgi:FlaA1/EpsC-like NDP-sugar epimerase
MSYLGSINNRATPRWIIFLLDIGVSLITLILAYLLRFNFQVPKNEFETFYYVFPFVVGVRTLSFIIGKTYAGIVRYTSAKDTQRIFLVSSAGSLVMILCNLFSYYFINQKYIVPLSVIFIEYLALSFILVVYRISIKIVYFEFKSGGKDKANVLILGAGESGIITKRTLDRDAGTRYKVIGYIDDNPALKGKKLEGSQIFPSQELDRLLEENEIKFLILSVQNIAPSRKQEIAEICFKHNTRVLNVPPVNSWINGELSFKQIKKIKIEDLLERDPIKLDEQEIKKYLFNKTILITGAAGSIGSGLARQIVNYRPAKLILLDQAESPLYDLELEFKEKHPQSNVEVVIGDICNRDRMQHLFTALHPEVVFHAAAYKHVPMMENNPAEAVETNVFGTKNLAELASEFSVQKFVMVSTDKAVNPTNIMGASKRIAEIFVQSLNKEGHTRFVTTRFGNVLGSNGSVIPRFKKQIEEGGPITITDPEITRYFMTIPEACQLVLEAGAMGKGGEIYVFDMGKSVKIADLAKKMIKLSGLSIGKDIQIVYTGLRPGEKLYEELLNNAENTIPTHHPQILIGKVRQYHLPEVKEKLEDLKSALALRDNFAMVTVMKQMVPEFVSNNSVFEQLDQK